MVRVSVPRSYRMSSQRNRSYTSMLMMVSGRMTFFFLPNSSSRMIVEPLTIAANSMEIRLILSIESFEDQISLCKHQLVERGLLFDGDDLTKTQDLNSCNIRILKRNRVIPAGIYLVRFRFIIGKSFFHFKLLGGINTKRDGNARL